MKQIHAIIAEFDGPQALAAAAERLRDAGYRRWDAHTPYPVHGMDAAMGLGRSMLPWIVFCGGATGFVIAFLLAHGTQGLLYPTVVQGKPTDLWTTPAYFPILFELTILLSAFAVVGGLMALAALPRWHHPIFESERFCRRATDDGFFLVIEARDPKFEREGTSALLADLGGADIEIVEEPVHTAA